MPFLKPLFNRSIEDLDVGPVDNYLSVLKVELIEKYNSGEP